MAIDERARTIGSRLIVGTTAVVTASALALAGVTTTGSDLPSSPQLYLRDDLTLTAFASPLLEIYDTIQKTNLYLFSIAEPPTTTFDRAGIIPDFLAAGFPILTQYFLNAPDYVNQSLNYLFQDFGSSGPIGPYPGAFRILTWAADALPANIGYAAQQVFSGNLVGALDTLQFAVGNPVQAALYQTLNAGLYVLGGVAARVAAVMTEVAEWVPTTIKNLADDVTVVMNAAANVVRNVVYGVQTLNVETIWNALVVGLLGSDPNPATPTIPDALINQTIGEGGRIYPIPGQPSYNEIPSIRQNIADLRDAIADALATDVPIPEEPPYPVSGLPYSSQIPTPWNPTPGPPAMPAAAVSAVGASAPHSFAGATATNALNPGPQASPTSTDTALASETPKRGPISNHKPMAMNDGTTPNTAGPIRTTQKASVAISKPSPRQAGASS